MKNTIQRFLKKAHRGAAVSAALFLMIMLLFAIPANARGSYTYTVRLYSGSQGIFNEKALANVLRDHKNQIVSPESIGAKMSVNASKDEVTISGIPVTDGTNPYRIVYDVNLVTVTNQKYLPYTNFRESGKDNNTIDTASFMITEDMDLIVGYYIASGIVSYTVNYVDESGAPVYTVVDGARVSSEVHYGNAGDRLVVAFPYVEGYQPRAYNGVLTLSADSSKNVFNFPYREIAPEAESSSSAAESSGTAESSSGNAADESGNQTATDAEGNPLPTDDEGRLIPTDAEGNTLETDDSGNIVEPSGGENESVEETESASEEGTAGTEEQESTSGEIQETMEFNDETSGPAASSDFSGDSSGEGGTGDGRGTGEKILNVIRHPVFIAGSVAGIAGIAVLVTVIVRKGRKQG